MINLLISTQRTALRDACLSQMAELTRKWPDRRAIMIVPEQTKMDMERDYLAVADKPGLMLAEILSFRRLAWRLAGEVGGWPAQSVDSVGQAMLIQRILKQKRKELKILGELGEKPGYIRQIASVLGDLKRYQINPLSLLQAQEKITDTSLRDKAADFGLILQAYEQALSQAGLSDSEEDLGRLTELLRKLVQQGFAGWPWQRLSWLARTCVWVNGFGELRDFTPQEESILQYLSQLTQELNISVAADHVPFSSQAVSSGPDMFYIGRRTAWRLRKNLPVAKIEEIPCHMNKTAAQTALCLSRHSQKLPPAQIKSTGDNVNGGIVLLRSPDEDNEIGWVAGEIRRLVQEEGYRYRDFAVAACNLRKMAPLLRSIFRVYNIPIFLDQDSSLAGTPLMRLVLGILNIGISGWNRWSVMSFLRSGLIEAESSEIDNLENYLLARGLFREDRLFSDQHFAAAEDRGEVLLAWRDKILLPVRNLLIELKKANSAPEKCTLLQRYLRDTGVPNLIEIRSARLMAEGESEAAVNLVKSWNELDRIMVQMVRLTEDISISFQAFRDMVQAAVETARSGIIPTAVDQVNIGDLQRGYLHNPSFLFIIGATADSLPPAWPPEGLLKDLDRQLLSEVLDLQLPSHGRDQACSDGFLIYTLLTLPQKRLYLSVAGSEVSPWYQYLCGLYPQSEIVLPEQPAWNDPRLNSLQAAFSYYLIHKTHITKKSTTETCRREERGWTAVRRILQNADMPMAQIESLLAKADDVGIVRLAPTRVQQLYGEKIRMSVSQLEQYAGCPFLHLAGYLLDLQERAVWEPEKTETGILLHSTVELAFRQLLHDLLAAGKDIESKKKVFQDWLSSDLEVRSEEWLQQAAAANNLQRILEQGLRASAGRRTRRLTSASVRAMLGQYLSEDYLPVQLEWIFGRADAGQLGLLLEDGRQVEFRGKVDRVDQTIIENNICFRIIDYKSGNRFIDYDALYHGLSLQLPLYLEAYSRQYPDYLAVDAAYYYFDRPIINVDPQDRADDEKIGKKLAGKAKLRNLNLQPDELSLLRRHSWQQAECLTKNLAAGDFDVKPARIPGKAPQCAWCSYLPVCGFYKLPGNYRWLQPVTRICGESGKLQKKQAFLRCLIDEVESE